MKRQVVFFGLLFAVSLQLFCSAPLSSSEREELTQIVKELKSLTEEQERIIEASKKRNEELESLSKSQEQKLNERLALAGIEVVEARINYLAYAPEIAAVMLRRQQASAIITAREKIVEGAVSMVKMALDKLSTEEIVELDDDKKAAMVSNLLVVLCGDDSAQPVVNTGTLNH